MRITRAEGRRLGSVIVSTALFVAVYLRFRASTVTWYYVELLMVFALGLSGGSWLGEIVYNKWILPTQESPEGPEPTPFIVWVGRSLGLILTLCSLWLTISLAKSRSLDLSEFVYVTLLLSPGVALIGIQSRSLISFAINLLIVLFDLACFVLSPDWRVLAVTWLCLAVTLICLLLRHAVRSREAEQRMNGPLAPQT